MFRMPITRVLSPTGKGLPRSERTALAVLDKALSLFEVIAAEVCFSECALSIIIHIPADA
jgi:hypothetical protein